jgi:hypothetical protein
LVYFAQERKDVGVVKIPMQFVKFPSRDLKVQAGVQSIPASLFGEMTKEEKMSAKGASV